MVNAYWYQAVLRGSAWYLHEVDDRFEHHDGAQLLQLPNGKTAIVSHGWADSK